MGMVSSAPIKFSWRTWFKRATAEDHSPQNLTAAVTLQNWSNDGKRVCPTAIVVGDPQSWAISSLNPPDTATAYSPYVRRIKRLHKEFACLNISSS